MKIIALFVVLLSGFGIAGPVPLHIASLKGCFHVTYRFVEDGKKDMDLRDLEGKPIVEWVSDQSVGSSYTLQHWGVYFDSTENKYLAMKHWSESWEDLGSAEWRQTVHSPYGKVRYVCQGKLHFNQLRCSAENTPKPQRDTNRKDYDVLDRENTFQFTPSYWIQAERNLKKLKDGTEVSTELGWIEYVRVDEAECQPAKDEEANRQ